MRTRLAAIGLIWALLFGVGVAQQIRRHENGTHVFPDAMLQIRRAGFAQQPYLEWYDTGGPLGTGVKSRINYKGEYELWYGPGIGTDPTLQLGQRGDVIFADGVGGGQDAYIGRTGAGRLSVGNWGNTSAPGLAISNDGASGGYTSNLYYDGYLQIDGNNAGSLTRVYATNRGAYLGFSTDGSTDLLAINADLGQMCFGADLADCLGVTGDTLQLVAVTPGMLLGLTAANGAVGAVDGGDVSISAGSTQQATGFGGSITFQAGDSTAATGGGEVTLQPGTASSGTRTVANTGAVRMTRKWITAPTDATIASNGAGAPPATYTLVPYEAVWRLLCQDTGGCTITMSTTSVEDGSRVRIIGASGTNASTFTDGATLNLGAATRDIGVDDVLELMYSSSTSKWIEVSWANN